MNSRTFWQIVLLIAATLVVMAAASRDPVLKNDAHPPLRHLLRQLS